jgi:uncharacterized phage protein gp47/JayE
MAQIPTPRSYNDILGDMIDAFLSRFGLRSLKIGSPVLSMFESAAQSQLRSSEDIFNLLEASSLDQAKGVALDRIGADESVPRQSQNPASGTVSISDTSFTKISSKVFQGTPAPIVGSIHVNLTDASLFPASGNIYIGRGTSNFEGPLAFTSKLPPGSGFGESGGNYWTLVLSTGTIRFHNLGESVILAQAGDRDISAGTVVQTAQGNSVSAVQFRTLYKATIPDGETLIEGVTVVALKPGTVGNVPDHAVVGFSSDPFPGATVVNAQPFTNGVPSETDDSYRERIRQARASRVRGTALALQTFSIGVTSPDENKRVLSASVVSRSGAPTTLYVDDGTGYEMSSAGIAIESFMDEATGGEDFFKISAPRPITKAFVLSTEVAPFTLSSGMQWAFTVGGVTTIHTVNDTQFRTIGNATAFELTSSINSNPTLNWSARTYANGTKVAVFAKADTNESIQYAPDAVSLDGNVYTGFSLGRVDTMRLYRNDRLLHKDGQIAGITSNGIALWRPISGSQDLQLEVDGTSLTNLVGGTYTFTDADFVAARTGYTLVGRNSPEAWASVFNARIPGITATAVNGTIVITSNRGASDAAKLSIAGGTLVNSGMFDATPAPVLGAASDYVLDRNTGEIKLAEPLLAGDRLAAGSVNTRAFLESPALNTITVSGAGAHLWFATDAGAVLVTHGVTASTPLNFTSSSPSWGKRQRITSSTASALFSNVAVGDWAIFWDQALPSDLLNRSFRVAAVSTIGTWFEIERATAAAVSNPLTLTNGGLSFVRTASSLQAVEIAAGTNYTASTLAPLLDAALVGAQATVYRTQALRVNTRSFSDVNGDIAVVAADLDGLKLGLDVTSAQPNLTGHLASTESANSDLGTPDFHQTWVTNGPAIGLQPRVDWNADTVYSGPSAANQLVGLRPVADGLGLGNSRYGEINGLVSPVSAIASAGGNIYNLTLRNLPYETLTNDRWYWASPFRLASDDSVTVLVDNDTESKRFVIPMWRQLSTVGTVYAGTNTFKDADNGGQSLGAGFGYTGNGFDFNDFAVYMAARAKTHDIGDTSAMAGGVIADLTRTVLWRWFRLGADGNKGRVRYGYPAAEDLAVSVDADSNSSSTSDVSIRLGSGPLKTGYTLPAYYPVGTAAPSTTSGLTTAYYILAFPVASMSITANVATLTLTLPAGVTHTGLDLTGATSYRFVASAGVIPTGDYAPTAEVDAGGGIYSKLTFSYTHADTAPVANPGVLYLYSATTATLAGASPAVGLGDFLRVETRAGLPTAFKGTTVRIANNVVTNPYWIETKIEGFTGGLSGTVTYAAVGDPTSFKIFANLAQTTATIAAAVNALAAAADSTVPVTATLIGDGSSTIDRSSSDDAGTSSSWASLTDGVNYVNTTTVPSVGGDYALSFKNPITAALATNSDWGNETVRVVPTTTKNVVDWFNAPTVSGLFSTADVERSSNGRKVQVASLTPGSSGSIEVQGGTANAVTAAVVGSSVLASTFAVATIASTDAPGFIAGATVSIDNETTLPKPVFTSASALQSIANDGLNSVLHVTGSSFFTRPASLQPGIIASFERQGRFWCITDTRLGSTLNTGTLAEGDYVKITADSTPTYVGVGGNEAVADPDQSNVGIFRVVRVVSSPDVGGRSIWIENSAGVAQPLAECIFDFYNSDGVVVGDILSISTSLWDGSSSNQGRYEVVAVGDDGGGDHNSAFYITVGPRIVDGLPMSVVAAPVAALGSSARQVQLIEGTPTRQFKQILSIGPNQADGSLYDVKFTTGALFGKIGATAGSIITALDKLQFPAGINRGIDGYQHTTGLIAEVSKVIQGDPSDNATYPGVAAAGATVNISGPLVKRIQVTLSVRVRSGSPTADVEARVKSAVASVINKTPIGTNISLSDLTTAAGKVGGVISAVMVSPVASAGSDLISVQAYEKPLVLNVDQDVLVSFAGD